MLRQTFLASLAITTLAATLASAADAQLMPIAVKINPPTARLSSLDGKVGDAAAALVTVNRTETLFEKFPSRDHALATVKWLKAEAFLRTGKSAWAEDIVVSALGLAKELAEGRQLYGNLLLVRRQIFKRNADIQKAVQSYNEAHNIFATLGEARGEAVSLYLMGSIHHEAESYEKALEYFEKSGKRFSKDQNLALSLFNSQGLSLQRLGQYDAARTQYRQSLAVAESLKSAVLKGRILTNLAELEVEAGRLDVATEQVNKALALFSRENDTHWARFALGIKASIHLELGKTAAALDLVERAFAGVDLTSTSLPYMDMHDIAHDVYAAQGNFEMSLQHFASFKRLSDDAKKAASSANAALLGARLQFSKKQIDIERLKTEKLQKDFLLQDENRQNAIQYAVMIVGGLSAVFFFILAAGFRNNRNRVAKISAQLEATTQKLNDEITYREVVENDLTSAKDASEEANRAKSTFLAMMSHELRTPMNGILGFSNVLLGTELSHEQRDHLQIIESSGQSLLTLINDILDLSQIEAGKFKLRPAMFDFHTMVQHAVKLLSAKAQEKNLGLFIHIDSNLPRHVDGDGNRIRQILINMVGNAIKFTEFGAVTVIITKGIGEHSIRMAVSDSGIGIPANKIKMLFKPFNQIDSSATRNFGGTGLGLAISRELTEAMGGTMGVNSNFGEGSEFWVDIPLPAVQQNNVLSHSNRRQMNEPISVIVIDETRINRDAYKLLLTSMNIIPLITATTEEALGMLVVRKQQGDSTDAIIVGGAIECASAEAFVSRVRQNALAPTAKIILATSNTLDADSASGMGFAGVINQPITETKIFNQLSSPQGLSTSEQETLENTGRVISLSRPMYSGQVLIADDNDANQKLVATLLQSMGVTVDTVSNGAEAVKAATSRQYQMIIMDLNMPIMNGVEAARRIHKLGECNAATPIIAFTADAFVQDTDEGQISRMSGVLQKPINVNELTALVREHVERRKDNAAAPGIGRRGKKD